MGQTFNLECKALGVHCWIGQNAAGRPGVLSILYTTPEHLGRLQRFLVATYGHHLVMVEDNELDEDSKEFEGENELTRWAPPP